MNNNRVKMYESDIPAEVKILSQYYHNAEIPKLNISFLDIEVDYNTEIGFSSISNPYAPINAIAIHHQWCNRSVVYAVPPPGWDPTKFNKSLLELSEIVFCETEKELLLHILDEFEDSDVLSGWNSDFFDMPYIAKRIEMKLGKSYLRKLSFDGAEMPKYRDVEVFGNMQTLLEISGRVSLDYMQLFKKYEMSQRASYKLEAIADEFLPHLPKLEYEGSLADLYVNNFNHFLRYNIRDTEILRGFEDTLGYVALANVMCHTSTAQFKHVFGTLQLTDLAIINYCHYELDVKVPDWWEKPDGSIQGAYVLYPQIGMHEWIGSIDINSLYPSAIRSINISPETIIGQFSNNINDWEKLATGTIDLVTLEYDDGSSEEHTALEWRTILIQRTWSVSGYGTVFNQSKQGVVPNILTTWYAQRKQYQKQKNELYEKAQCLLKKYG
jgi:DNA polymerase elongation subunit (family B)